MSFEFPKADRNAQRRYEPARRYIGRAAAGCVKGVFRSASVRRRHPVGFNSEVEQGGFSLIEVMVTLVVLGIGMLGLAALQITGMRVNDGALMRTRAVTAATDLADRVRAQPDAFKVGVHSGVSLSAGACASPPECADPVTCWRKDFCSRYQATDGPQALPPPSDGNTAEVDCSNAGGCGNGNCSITIRWSDERAGRGDPGGGGDLEFRFCTRMPSTL